MDTSIRPQKKSGIVRRILYRIGSSAVLLAILASIIGTFAVRNSFPQVNGEIKLKGLEGSVDVYRDSMGIPHIYASNIRDLFMAQGYVHAQDRFWQMDFWRHVGSGRVSEFLGESQIETDAFLRTLGWRQIAEQEYASADLEAKAILDSYSMGVNAYLAERKGIGLSLEYGILKINNPDYVPEPWTPVHTLTWGKSMSWDLKGNINQEIERAILLKSLSPSQVDELFPEYSRDLPVIVPNFENLSGYNLDEQLSLAATLPVEVLTSLTEKISLLDKVLGPSGAEIGSNNWVVSGKLTASGKPLLANDPHLGIQMPSIWYQNGLFCRPITEMCPFSVTGFSFAGVPGVVIGHNDHIAWGVTNLSADVMDLYIEKINPENSNQYEYLGQWLDMEIRKETIHVAGGAPIELIVRSTIHGPLITDVYGRLEDFADNSGIELPENYALALRWTALEPSKIFNAVWELNKARNWDEFRNAARDFVVPAQNLVYGDVDGNIGYQMPGNIPIRKNGNGRLPVPGWTGEYDWTGYIPFEELPFILNPPEGYIVTANNQVHPFDYEYLISTDWDYGYRARRIVELIEDARAPIEIGYFQRMHVDNFDSSAAILVPEIMKLDLEDGRLIQVRALFEGWDYQNHADSAPAALYSAFWRRLLSNAFGDDLPGRYQPGGSSRWFEVARRVVEQPNSPWWDSQLSTDIIETRDDIMVKSFAEAVSDLESKLGKNPSNWKWGGLHVSIFRNQTLGQSGIAPIEALLNRGPFPTSGGSSIVNATGWDADKGFEVTSVPSMRMIIDFDDFNNSAAIHTTGQSGHAYHPHYFDMTEMWLTGLYYQMWWDERSIISNAASHLLLVP